MITEQRNGFRIVDRRGDARPSSMFLYPSVRYSGARNYRPVQWLSPNIREQVDSYDRWELANVSRQLFAQIPVLGGAVLMKNRWAFSDGWVPHFAGLDKEWGEEVEAWLINKVWPAVCLDAAGGIYDFNTAMFCSGIAWDVDGDDLMVLTERDGGFPAVQYISSMCIANSGTAWGGGVSDQIKAGPFSGAKIRDGIIYDNGGDIIGYRAVGRDGKTLDLSIRDAQLNYDPEWACQERGIPTIGRPSLDWKDWQDIQMFLKRKVKRLSAIALKKKMADPQAPAMGNVVLGNDPNAVNVAPNTGILPGQNPPVTYEEINGGEAIYLSAPDGEDLEELQQNQPSPNVAEFLDRIEMGALYAIGWPRALVDSKGVSGAPTRMVIDLANASIRGRQRTGLKRALRILRYCVAKGMKYGFIPRNKGKNLDDAYQWWLSMPRELQCDAGNEDAADRAGLLCGNRSFSDVSGRNGTYWKDLRRQRETEERDRIDRAVELVTYARQKLAAIQEQPEAYSFAMAMNAIAQTQPNAVQTPVPQQQQAKEKPEQKPKEGEES